MTSDITQHIKIEIAALFAVIFTPEQKKARKVNIK